MSKRWKIALAMAVLGLVPVMEATAQRGEDRSRAAEVRARGRADMARGGWIGIMYHVSRDDGRVVVSDVVHGSPADAAGLAPGDTILRWNGSDDPGEAITQKRLQPGDTLRVRVRRSGERDRDLTIVAAPATARPVIAHGRRGDVLVLRPSRALESVRIHMDSVGLHADSLHRRLRIMLQDSLGPAIRQFEAVEMPRIQAQLEAAQAQLAHGMGVGSRSVAGAEFAEVNAGLATYFGTDRGALVLRVAPDTPADRSGLQAGDVVISANGNSIDEVRDLRETVARSRDRNVDLVIVRRGARTELKLSWE